MTASYPQPIPDIAMPSVHLFCQASIGDCLHDSQQEIIIGVDEVGRGCLFGQMTVAACILLPKFAKPLGASLHGTPFAWLNDSKKLSPKKRQVLYQTIHQHANCVIVDVPAVMIDAMNIHQATLLGMKIALTTLLDHHHFERMPTILVDGKYVPVLEPRHQAYEQTMYAVIQGDGCHASMACASVLAKVWRDNAMLAYANQYPNFDLDKHKGYPTTAHKNALARFGVLPEHRRSYAPIRQLLDQSHGVDGLDKKAAALIKRATKI